MRPTELEFKEFESKAKSWAIERLRDENTVIVDTETTGLPSIDPDTEVCQISVINTKGRPLLSLIVKPNKPMSQEVIDIHKINNEDVKSQPTFPQIASFLSFVLEGKHIVCYNSGFDIKILWNLYKKYSLKPPKVLGISCAMEKYSEFKGEWNDKKDGFRWHKLPQLGAGMAHDSLTDCVSTLRLLQLMAGEYSPYATKAEDIDLNF